MIKFNARTKKTTFQMSFPQADSAYVVGDFNNWSKSEPMKKLKNGSWKAELKLEPGEYQFKYFVDDARWENDEEAPRVPNSLGSENSLLVVKQPAAGGSRARATTKKPRAKKSNGKASAKSATTKKRASSKKK